MFSFSVADRTYTDSLTYTMDLEKWTQTHQKHPREIEREEREETERNEEKREIVGVRAERERE